jgi:hypothetical protein
VPRCPAAYPRTGAAPGRTSAAGRNLTLVHPHPGDTQGAWEWLRSRVRSQAPELSAPQPPGAGLCASCRGPARPGGTRCYQCDLHAQCAPGGLADLVVPVAYAPKGGLHARNLWIYKSGHAGSGAARDVLRAMLVVFLRDHGPCVWQHAGMPAPTHLAVVPSGRGRGGSGSHPLRELIAPYLAMPWAELSPRCGAGHPVRDLDPDRFGAPPLPGARVALLDDTWTSGASAQSAAMSLRLAGARSVAIIVLGRHLTAGDWAAAGQHAAGRADFSPAAMPFRLGSCAVHRTAGEGT